MLTNYFLIANLQESGQISLDMLKQIIQSQHSLAIYGITVLVALAILIAGSSWLTNFYLSKRKFEELESELNSKINNETKKISKNIESKVHSIKDEITENLREGMILLTAEQERLFAIHCEKSEHWENAIIWWTSAIEHYSEVNEDALLRTAVDALKHDIKKCEEIESSTREDIDKCINFIPYILKKESEEIKKAVKLLKIVK